MKSVLRVAAPPAKPLLVFDGDCNFCKFWVARWQKITGDAVDYLPSQDQKIAAQFPEIPAKNFAESVQFIEPDGKVFSGAQAVCRSLAVNPNWRWPEKFYQRSKFFSALAEGGYRFIARHRDFFSRLMFLHE